MITIAQSPQKFTPAFNPVVFSLTSDNYDQPDFKFVADVYNGSGAILASLKYQAQVIGTDPVLIDISRIVNELVNADYMRVDSVLSPAIVSTSGRAIADYSVQFGEQYGGVVHSNLVSYSGYVFNGAMETLRFAFFDQDAWINTRFLSNFQRQTVRKQDSVMLSVIQGDVAAISEFDLVIYNAAGASILSTSVNNPYTSLSAANHRILHLHVGFDYLYATLAFSSTIYNQAQYYTITPDGGTPYRVDLYSKCERFPGVRLHFLNEMGGFDSFNFVLDRKESQSTEKKQFLRMPTNKATGYDSTNRRFEVLNRNYYTRTTRKLKVTSDYLYDQEAQQLRGLLSSSLIYMEADAADYGGTGMVLVPIDMKTLDYEVKKTRTDKLFNMELDVDITTDNYAQVI